MRLGRRVSLVLLAAALAGPALAQRSTGTTGGAVVTEYGPREAVRVADLAPAAARLPVRAVDFDLRLGEVEHDGVVDAVLTDDGQRLISAGAISGTVASQDPATGALQWAADLGDGVFGVDVAGGVVVAALARTGEAVVLDAATGAVRHRVPLPGEPARVRLAPGGRLAVVGSVGANVLSVVATDTGAVETQIAVPFRVVRSTYVVRHNRRILGYTPFEVTPDGLHVVVGGDAEVSTFALDTGARTARAPVPAVSRGIALSDAGTAGVVAAGHVTFYDVRSGAAETVAFNPAVSPAGAGIGGMSPDGTRALVHAGLGAAVVTRDGTVTPIANGAGIGPIGGGAAVAWGPDGATRIDLATMRPTRTQPYGEPPATPFLVSRGGDGSLAAMSGRFETATVARFKDVPAPTARVPFGDADDLDAPRSLAVSPSGERVAVSAYATGRVAVFERRSRALVAVLETGLPRVEGLAFVSEDDVLAVGAGPDGFGTTVRVSVATGDAAVVLSEGPPSSHAHARDARAFVHSALTGLFRVFDKRGPALVYDRTYALSDRTLALQSFTATDVVVGPRGTVVASPNVGTTGAVVADMDVGSRALIPSGLHVDRPAFSPSGALVAFSSWDGAVLVVETEGTPSVVASAQLPHPVSAVAFDGSRGAFVFGTFAPAASGPVPALLYAVDPSTGAATPVGDLPETLEIHDLLWSAEAGLVVVGRLADGTGAVVTDDGTVTRLDGELGEVVLAGDEVLVAATAADRLVAIVDRPTARPARPVPAQTLAALGTPTRGALRVRLDGAPRARARVEAVDLLGRVAAVLHDGPFPGGPLDLAWPDPAPGAYVVRLVGTAATARATVVR